MNDLGVVIVVLIIAIATCYLADRYYLHEEIMEEIENQEREGRN